MFAECSSPGLAAAAGRPAHEGKAVWTAQFASKAQRGLYLRRDREVVYVAGQGKCRTLFVHAGLLPDEIEHDPQGLVSHCC
jgi:hypothetical protein